MSNMRSCRDSFLQFLADNLPGTTIHAVRFDASDPQTNVLQVNAVNVTFGNTDFDTTQPLEQLTSVDVIADTESSALSIAEQLVDVLQKAAYTPLMDYSVTPAVPVGNRLVFWDTAIKFRIIHADNYFHYSATIHLRLQFN